MERWGSMSSKNMRPFGTNPTFGLIHIFLHTITHQSTRKHKNSPALRKRLLQGVPTQSQDSHLVFPEFDFARHVVKEPKFLPFTPYIIEMDQDKKGGFLLMQLNQIGQIVVLDERRLPKSTPGGYCDWTKQAELLVNTLFPLFPPLPLKLSS